MRKVKTQELLDNDFYFIRSIEYPELFLKIKNELYSVEENTVGAAVYETLEIAVKVCKQFNEMPFLTGIGNSLVIVQLQPVPTKEVVRANEKRLGLLVKISEKLKNLK